MLFAVTLSISAWPRADHRVDALADVRRDVGVGQPSLQFLPAGVELGQRRLGVTAGRTRQHCAVERGHVALDRGHHFGAVGGAPQIGRLRRARVDAQSAERAGQNQRHQNDREHFPADRPIRDRPSRRSLGRWLRLWFEIDERAVRLLQLRERGHRRPPLLSAACPQFSNGASFIRLPADFALGWARVLRLAIGRVCQPCAAVSTILTEQTEFITSADEPFRAARANGRCAGAFGPGSIVGTADVLNHRMFRLMFYSPASRLATPDGTVEAAGSQPNCWPSASRSGTRSDRNISAGNGSTRRSAAPIVELIALTPCGTVAAGCDGPCDAHGSSRLIRR